MKVLNKNNFLFIKYEFLSNTIKGENPIKIIKEYLIKTFHVTGN